jgi:hypothetical protein
MIRGAQPEVIILDSGTFILGRDPGCDYQLTHPSISTAHCEIRRDRGRVFIRDLGSTNGTFIEDKAVAEAELLPDQLIRFGDTIWKFQGSSLQVGEKHSAIAPEPEATPVAPAISIGVNRSAKREAEAALKEIPPVQRPCSKHIRKPAIYICGNCRSEFCTECVRTRKTSKGVRLYCPTCNSYCEDIGSYEIGLQTQHATRERNRNLFLCLGEVFRYPFRASGIALLLGGSLMMAGYLVMMAWAAHAGPFGFGAIILYSFLFFGYFTAYLHKIVQASANGDQELPDWPDFSSIWDDIGQPALQILGVWLVSFGPVKYYIYQQQEAATPWIWVPLLLGGMIYFPMACLSVAVFNTILAANPLTVFVSMFKVLQNYSLAILIFWAAFIFSFLVDIFAGLIPTDLLAVRLAIWAISIPVSVYLVIIEARVLGLIYFGNSDKLGWFDEKK